MGAHSKTDEHYSLSIWRKFGYERRSEGAKGLVCRLKWVNEAEWWQHVNHLQIRGPRSARGLAPPPKRRRLVSSSSAAQSAAIQRQHRHTDSDSDLDSDSNSEGTIAIHVDVTEELQESLERRDSCVSCVPSWQHGYDGSGSTRPDRLAMFKRLADDQLRAKFNLATFKPLQLDAILACQIEERKNVVVHMETGGGKTLIYHMLTQLNSDIITFCLIPFTSLKKDAAKRAENANVKHWSLDGGKPEQVTKVLDDMVAHPERYCGGLVFLTAEMWAKRIGAIQKLSKEKMLGRIVIDEAHYVTECDDRFREKYRALGPSIRNLFNGESVLLLTASMNVDVISCLMVDFGLKLKEDLFLSSRPEQHLATHRIALKPRLKSRRAIQILQEIKVDSESGPGLVFCLTKSDAQRTAEELKKLNVTADFYHADRSVADKERIGAEWQNSAIQVLCATPGFGLGIDKAGIYFVHHLQMPMSMSTLQQQLGRGRAQPDRYIKCTIWHSIADEQLAARILQLPMDPVTDEDKRRAANLRAVHRFALQTSQCLRQAVVKAAFDNDHLTCTPCAFCNVCQKSRTDEHQVSLVLKNVLSPAAFPELHNVNKAVTKREVIRNLEADDAFDALRLPHGTAEKLLASLILYEVIEAKGQSVSKGPWFDKLGSAIKVSVDDFEARKDSHSGNSYEHDQDDVNYNYEVEEILDKRTGGNNRLEYRVKWAARYGAVSSISWEPVTNLDNCQALLEEFNRRSAPHVRGGSVRSIAEAPDSIRDLVEKWSPLTTWIVHHLISINELRWTPTTCDLPYISRDIAMQLFEARDDLMPLKYLLRERFEWLPPKGSRFSIQFSASVRLENSRLKWSLNWPEVARRHGSAQVQGVTKRIYSKYGSANILTVKISQNGDDGEEIVNRLIDPAFVLEAGGREWWKPKAKIQSDGHRLIFFAKPKFAEASTASLELLKHGRNYDCMCCTICRNCKARYKDELSKVEHGPIDEWHFNMLHNGDKTIAKALFRSNLQFSSAVPTIVMAEKDIIHEQAKQYNERKDGASGIAPDLLTRVWREYLRKTGGKYEGFTPSLFQGRLGSRKGIWSCNPNIPPGKIVYRDEQLKYTIKRPDSHQLTIEVCKFFSSASSQGLNKQVIVVLEPRMQDPRILERILKEELEKKKEVLVDPSAAENFCRNVGIQGSRILEKYNAGYSHDSELVQCGLVRAMTNECKRLFDDGRFKIPLPESSYLPIIPDEHHLLKPEEIIVMHPNSRLFGLPVLLCRNPCYDPGELLLKTCVDPHELLQRIGNGDTEGFGEKRRAAHGWYAAQKCCIIMSVLGPRELGEADKMSGGDYDGDCCTCIWDERILSNLRECQPLVYSEPDKNPLGQIQIDKIPLAQRAYKLWAYFKHLIREQSGSGANYKMTGIAQCSVLHEAFADLAAQEDSDSGRRAGVWMGRYGRCARMLADFAHKAVDMAGAGYNHDLSDLRGWLERSGGKPIWQLDTPNETLEDTRRFIEDQKVDLNKIQKPQYCLTKTTKRAYVANFPRGMSEVALRKSFSHHYSSVCGAWVARSGDPWGFVYFADSDELMRALQCAKLPVAGSVCVIQSDTTKRTQEQEASMRDSTSVIAKLWQALADFELELRTGRFKIVGVHQTCKTDKQGFINRPAAMPPDLVLSAGHLQNDEIRDLVKRQWAEIKHDFARHSCQQEDTMEKISRWRQSMLPGTPLPVATPTGIADGTFVERLAEQKQVDELCEDALKLGAGIGQIVQIVQRPTAAYDSKIMLATMIAQLQGRAADSRSTGQCRLVRSSSDFDCYVAAWWLEFYHSHNFNLKQWGKKRDTAIRNGVDWRELPKRPEPLLAVDFVFGKDWCRIRSVALPPESVSKRSAGVDTKSRRRWRSRSSS